MDLPPAEEARLAEEDVLRFVGLAVEVSASDSEELLDELDELESMVFLDVFLADILTKNLQLE